MYIIGAISFRCAADERKDRIVVGFIIRNFIKYLCKKLFSQFSNHIIITFFINYVRAMMTRLINEKDK